jgi:hypothetical protein
VLAVCASLFIAVPGSIPASAAETPLVLAFYYAWYDQNIWGSGQVLDQPVHTYASTDPATIARQVSQAQSAGIDAFIQSWYGPRETDNQTETNLRTLLDIAGGQGFRAAVDFETAGPFFPDQASVTEGLRSLLATHAQHPAYLRYQGKPVIFFWKQERFGVDTWAAIRSQVDPGHASWWIAEGVDLAYQAVFDGHHLYNIAWASDPARTLADWGSRVRRYASERNLWRLWVATAMPGFNNSSIQRQAPLVVGRQGGAYYRQTWAAAMASRPDWIVVTSFNEWVEGSMIEPSVSYGNLYLDITRELAPQFKSARPQAGDPIPVAAPAPAASSGSPTPAPPTEPATPAGPTVRAIDTVRVRSGPGTEFDRIGRLADGTTAAVVGKNADGSWWQIRFSGATDGLGWVSALVVIFSGDASAVPVVSGPATSSPTPTPTPVPAPIPSSTATLQPTPAPAVTPGAGAGGTALASPTATPSLTLVPTDTPAATPEVLPTPTWPVGTALTIPTATELPAQGESPLPTPTWPLEAANPPGAAPTPTPAPQPPAGLAQAAEAASTPGAAASSGRALSPLATPTWPVASDLTRLPPGSETPAALASTPTRPMPDAPPPPTRRPGAGLVEGDTHILLWIGVGALLTAGALLGVLWRSARRRSTSGRSTRR